MTEQQGPAASPLRAAAEREVLFVVHTGRERSRRTARQVATWFTSAGLRLRMLADEAEAIAPDSDYTTVDVDDKAAEGTELVFVLGGDGTLLRAAELALPAGVPVLGVNLGRVGFLAEAEPERIGEVVAYVLEQRYQVQERMTIDVTAWLDGEPIVRTWALNEASVEKTSRERILDILVEVDGRPVSSFGGDGVLCATPTGSTAYAFSAGGPIVWPDVQAVLVVPSNAHAMFARPLVVSPSSVVGLNIDNGGLPAVLCVDGRRTYSLPAGCRVEVVEGANPLRLVRLHIEPFTDRLVSKFALPVRGWREIRAD